MKKKIYYVKPAFQIYGPRLETYYLLREMNKMVLVEEMQFPAEWSNKRFRKEEVYYEANEAYEAFLEEFNKFEKRMMDNLEKARKHKDKIHKELKIKD